jgi:UDP-N-acetyl-D-galactosamine dehydrogenase
VHEYGIELIDEITDIDDYGAVILAVSHDEFKKIDFQRIKNSGAIIYDVKSILPKELVDARL